MDTEEHTHLMKLRYAYVKRMRILELKQAKMGLEAPEHIFTEIDELLEKIATIDAQLNGAGLTFTSSPASIIAVPIEQVNTTKLVLMLTTHFDDGELRNICSNLGIDYERLPGQDKARELIGYANHHGHTVELVSLCRRLRPHADWHSVIPKQCNSSPTEIPTTDAVQIEIVFKGDFDALTEEIQQRTIKVLAALVDVPPDQIRIVKVTRGSIIFRVEMPKEAVDRLMGLYESQDPTIEELDIADIRVVQVPVTIGSDLPDKELVRQANLELHCTATVAALNTEFGWELSVDEQYRYCTVLLSMLPEYCSDAELRTIVLHYHQDHTLVESLKDRGQAHHDEVWQMWMAHALRILQHAELPWPELAIYFDDLVQITHIELARALPSYRYTSRFSTWSYQIIVESVQRYLQDLQAQKQGSTSIRPIQLPSPHIMGRMAEAIASILAIQSDMHLTEIFTRWAMYDVLIQDIGRYIQFNPSHIRILLERIHDILQHIRASQESKADRAEDDSSHRT